MFLPTPPNDTEKYLYSDQNKTFLYSFGIVSSVLLLLGGLLFSLHRPPFFWYVAFICFTAFYLGISYFIGIFARAFDLDHHKWVVDEYAEDWAKNYSVDVFLPTAGEPLAILLNTYKYVCRLKWPGLNVYVLDDADRQEVRDAAAGFGFKYISRVKGPMKKAGNIRNAFTQSHGDFILILDADFCPRPDMLQEMVPYMMWPKTAIVQSPQFFRVEDDQPWIQRGAASVQELFYRLIQVNRNHYGASICVGTCALYRRTALAPHGGTYPIEHSEDVHTGFQMLVDGYRVVYIPVNLAAGACPDTIESFFTQQYRWCTGSTSLFLNRDLFWGIKLGIMARLSFLSGMLYYQATALGLFLTPIPAVFMLWFSPEHVYWYNVSLSLPSLLFGTLHMKMWNKQDYGLFVVKARAVSYYAHFFALLDRVRGSLMEWVPTGDGQAKKVNRVATFKKTMLVWSVAPALLGWAGFIYNREVQSFYHFAPSLAVMTFYAVLNLTCLGHWPADKRGQT